MKVFNYRSIFISILLILPALALTLITVVILGVSVLLCLRIPLIIKGQVNLADKNTYRAQICIGWRWFGIILNASPIPELGIGHRQLPYLTFKSRAKKKQHTQRSSFILPIHQQEWNALRQEWTHKWKLICEYGHYEESYLNIEFTSLNPSHLLNTIAYPLILFLNRYRLNLSCYGQKSEKNKVHLDAGIQFRLRLLNFLIAYYFKDNK